MARSSVGLSVRKGDAAVPVTSELQYRAGVSTPPRALFAGLLDDAAMFPPGNAAADVALVEHLRYRGSWFTDLVGPLLVPARAFDTFLEAHDAAGAPEVAVVLIGTTTMPTRVAPGVTVAGFETAVGDVPLPQVPPGTTLAAEISAGAAGGRVLAAVSEQAHDGSAVTAKFRTGGTTADAFPAEEVLGGVISLAVAAEAPIKLTAGLHHAIRFTDGATGFEHHGFLNVIVAVSRALAGGDRSRVSAALTVRDSEALVSEVRDLTADDIAGVRSRFVSFGCCGVEDPINDLVALELVEPR